MTTDELNGPMKLLLSALIFLIAAPAAAANSLPPGLVYLREVGPAIAQDMRYASSDNFTGRPVPGYQAGECVLRREVAEALKRVATDLARQNFGLKVYDCYRPARAVAAFWRWSQDKRASGDKRFYPHVDKRELFARGYIASHSRHSEGTAVDLTLVALSAAKPLMQALQTGPGSPLAQGRAENKESAGPCTAPAGERASDNSLDMGTGFDCLDPRSFTRSAAVTPEQHRLRLVLKSAMERRGFRNYFREWWHYEFRNAPRHVYDFLIVQR
jgi:D-alanyl-D-alanine dipeptidase